MKILRSPTVKIQNGHRVWLRRLYLVKKPQTLARYGMGDGLNRHVCTMARSSMSALFVIQIHFGGNTASLRNIRIAQIVDAAWTEVLIDGC